LTADIHPDLVVMQSVGMELINHLKSALFFCLLCEEIGKFIYIFEDSAILSKEREEIIYLSDLS